MSHRELIKSSNELIKGLFRDYYKGAQLEVPEDYMMREFAFQTFDSDSYIRHRSFSSAALLREYILEIVPKHMYFSSALYRDPAAENMDEKGWAGSDLIFDIDADDVPGCDPLTIKVCFDDRCDEADIVGSECMELAKKHEELLIDVLINDFGFNYDEIEVNFSGNRGFHTRVHPRDKSWLMLDSTARREIVDYLKGLGLDVRYLLLSSKRFKVVPPSPNEGGWRRRIAKLISRTNEVDEEHIKNLIKSLAISIDEKVTIDTSRLVRIRGSLNGKTGLKVVRVDPKALDDFKVTDRLSPFTKYSAMIIPTADLNGIEILGYKISLSRNMNYKVPASIAVFLALKGLAYITKLI